MSGGLTYAAPQHRANLDAPQKEPPLNIRLTVPVAPASDSNVKIVAALGLAAAQVTFSPPLSFPRNKKFKVTVYNCTVPYTSPNIGPSASLIPGSTNGNNRISIAWNGGARTDYLVPAGLYDIYSLAAALNQIAYTAGWIANPIATPLFIITGLVATQKAVLSVSPAGLAGAVFPAGGVVIDFLNPSVGGLNNSMGNVLGFDTAGAPATLTIAGGGAATALFPAPNVAGFSDVTQYVLYSDIISGSYVDGAQSGAMLSINLGGYTPNSIMSVSPLFEQPLRLGQFDITTAKFWWTDQQGRFLYSGFSAPWSIALAMESTGNE